MDETARSPWDPLSFSGHAPLFPLSNVVLFPHAVLPLHIFEPRYRQMTADALAGEQLIAMATYVPETAALPGGLRPIHPVVGLGRITSSQRVPDGRYYLELTGVSRARVLSEPATDRLYRTGELQLLHDSSTRSADEQRGSLTRLLQRFVELFPSSQGEWAISHGALDGSGLGDACDLLTSILPLSAVLSYPLLAESNVDARFDLLWTLLEQMRSGTAPTFPPGFSAN